MQCENKVPLPQSCPTLWTLQSLDIWHLCVYFYRDTVVCICVCSVVPDSATPWIVAHQTPPPIEFSRHEYCSRLPFPSPGDLPYLEIKLMSSALADRFFTTSATWEAHYVVYMLPNLIITLLMGTLLLLQKILLWTGLCIYFCTYLSAEYILRSWLCWSNGKCIFNSDWYCQIVFQRSCTNLHPRQQWKRCLFP